MTATARPGRSTLITPPAAPWPAGTGSRTTRLPRPSANGGLLFGLVRAARPRQWIKQGLVLAAPAAGGILLDPAVWPRLALAVAAFCLASSGAYLVNDALDVESDRLHPEKRHRPVASGQVPVGAALVAGAALGVLGLLTAAAVRPVLTLLVAAYLALTAAYSTYLKHRVVLDLAGVSGGFILRAAAGGVATGLPLSQWFLLVALFGSLVLVAGKRRSEQIAAHAGGASRAVLADYPPAYLDQVLAIGVGATLLCYAQWAASVLGDDQLVLAASVLPFGLALLRHLLLVHRGAGEAPERLAFRDRPLLLALVTWLVLVLAGTYL
jgi:decaprenyl-phosphate phosphoribosyltransferase